MVLLVELSFSVRLLRLRFWLPFVALVRCRALGCICQCLMRIVMSFAVSCTFWVLSKAAPCVKQERKKKRKENRTQR